MNEGDVNFQEKIFIFFKSCFIYSLGSKIFELKIRITPRILNHNQKYFNPLVSGKNGFDLGKT